MKNIFFDRDQSWLGFNGRILDEAADPEVPLLERFRFLSIYSSNLDEFYRVRYPIIRALHALKEKDRLNHNEKAESTADLHAVRQLIDMQQNRFGEILRQELLPALQDQGIQFLHCKPLSEDIQVEAGDIFFNKVLGYLQPVALKGSGERFFPENNRSYFLVVLDNGNRQRQVVVNIPTAQLGRFYELKGTGGPVILFLDDIIRHHLPYLFPGERIAGCYAVKVTRDATLLPEDDLSSDLAELVEKQLSKRDFGLVTRFIHAPDMPAQLLKRSLKYLEIDAESAVTGGHYHNLTDLFHLPLKGKGMVFNEWPAHRQAGPLMPESIFEQLHGKDLFVHTPYQSYDPVLRFFNEAANHPEVTDICTTVYRIASDSRIGSALISAARNGKRVRVLVELKARFDEHNNLRWAKQMQEAGVEIIYSGKKQKVHAKVTLVKRTGNSHAGYYGLISTGNFHEGTAKRYTDIVLMTANAELLCEVKKLFGILARKKKPSSAKKAFNELIVAPFNLRSRFLELINREIDNARIGRKASVFIKVNNLEERTLITKLYEASQAGVDIHLMVRSVCCLIPGIKGMSERITITRIVDRFLEHSRIFRFHNNGEEEIFIGSADWMNRNVYHRIEVCAPVKDPAVRDHINQCIRYWKDDNLKAVWLNSGLENIKKASGGAPLQAQEAIYTLLMPSERSITPIITRTHDIREAIKEDQAVH
ncbi:polyphosphate kinase 1 [Mucilaginibacter sp. SJ]|uniref:polyphosphate kinase 1 n=1 Tax=Mucilaginibacter sp. SJ TaxID=3029053 RepID=UPI0023A9FC43|nr:polyphosphate kinase 1 [Mucilaginibacter sp. SJ]WEA01788.1 polyphosphate kinase 1 [Mucilaginibacter sp. SJ]